MGTTTTVSRRMVKMKVVQKLGKPHAPLPRRPLPPPSDDEEMVGEEAKTIVMRAPAPRPVVQRTWWQKAMKPAGMALGAIVCGVFAYVVLNASDRQSYERRTETTASSSPTAAGRGRTQGAGSAYPGANVAEPIVLSKRSTPTDESFRATSYVRKKVYLPNIDGECVVKGGLDRVVAECLRGQD